MIIDVFGSHQKLANALFTLILVGMIALGGTSLVAAVFTDGRVTHCYVETAGHNVPMYRIVGHRNWRSDVTVGLEKTSEEAHAKMKELCP